MKRLAAIVAFLGALGLAAPAMAQLDLMQMADGNQDGKVTPDEYKSFSEAGWGFVSQGKDKVKLAELDDMAKGAFIGIAPDANGEISKATYEAAIPMRFKMFDTNGDGALSAAELNPPPPAN